MPPVEECDRALIDFVTYGSVVFRVNPDGTREHIPIRDVINSDGKRENS